METQGLLRKINHELPVARYESTATGQLYSLLSEQTLNELRTDLFRAAHNYEYRVVSAVSKILLIMEQLMSS